MKLVQQDKLQGVADITWLRVGVAIDDHEQSISNRTLQ